MMFAAAFIALALSTLQVVSAAPAPQPRAACKNYIIISTRGTGEAQGPTGSFRTMVRSTLSGVANGVEYDTVYPAGSNQQSQAGTADILAQINNGIKACPSQKYALIGYSQGSAATVDALKKLSVSSAAGKAVKAVFLIGSPQHKPGKLSNVDQDGGSSTDNATGISAGVAGAGIPTEWDNSGKVLDLCYKGDGVCSGTSITIQHTYYGSDSGVQSIGSQFLIARLK